MNVVEIGNVLLLPAAVAANAAPIRYAARVGWDWWYSTWGRHLMAYMTSLAGVLDVGVLRLFIPESIWFQVIRTVVFAWMVAMLWWRVLLFGPDDSTRPADQAESTTKIPSPAGEGHPDPIGSSDEA